MAKFFSAVFAVIGVVVMLAAIVICLVSTNSTVKILENPTGAVVCSEELAAAVNGGEFDKLEQLIYGQPKFGAGEQPAGTYGKLVWEAFLDSLSFSYTSKLYLLDADLARDASVSALDLATLSDAVSARARALLEEKVASAADMDELYAEDGQFRPELVAQVMQEALEHALREDVKTRTWDVTLRLIYRDGQWWAVPDQEFGKALSGLDR